MHMMSPCNGSDDLVELVLGETSAQNVAGQGSRRKALAGC